MTTTGDYSRSGQGTCRFVLLLGAVLLLGPATGVSAQGSEMGLRAHGPLDPENGWPLWYEDQTALVLRLCLPCVLDPTIDLPDPTAPVSFPDNFPDEAFWWLADARMPSGGLSGGGQARLVLALEAAFFGLGHPEPGQQIAFARLRIRVDDLQPGGTYTVTHPYGVEVFENVSGGIRGIDFTRDVGIDFPGDFDAPLVGDIGPFLVWDPIEEAPDGFIGDDVTPHRVTGSPLGTNLFRIEGPAVGGPGVDRIETDLFSITGQLATELPACSDGLDNDGDGMVDSDGGGVGDPDPQCAGDPFYARERMKRRCALGGELIAALLAPAAIWRRRLQPGRPVENGRGRGVRQSARRVDRGGGARIIRAHASGFGFVEARQLVQVRSRRVLAMSHGVSSGGVRVVLLALISVVWMAGDVHTAGEGQMVLREVSQAEALEIGRKPGGSLLLDVRSQAEYRAGHVPGAINIPHTQIEARLSELTRWRERQVVVYCERGGRASHAVEVLRKRGFGSIGHLTGDMSAWREAGLPGER